MDCSEACLDAIEAQRSTGVSHDAESVPKFLIDLRLSDLYNFPGEYVTMNSEILSAMRRGNIEFLEKMKSYKTPIECFKNNKGDSILHLAASFGHLELVKSIIAECPCLLLEPNLEDQLPIHVAAHAGHSAVVETLVATVTYVSARLSEEDRERLNIYVLKDSNGDTALHLALKDLHEKTKLLMYQHRNRKKTLLHIHAHRIRIKSNSFPEALARLMETAACLVIANQHVSFIANKSGISPLYLAVELGNVSLLNAMLNRLGSNVEGKTTNLASQLEGRKSLVHAALKAKNTDVLDIILNEDPSLINERDEDGRTCLSVGASLGFYEGICKLLDRSTSSVFECENDGSFPIHMAVERGHEDVVKELLKRCPDSIELLNQKGQNILHIAAMSGKVARFLTSYISRNGTKKHLIEEQDIDGNTPFHLATIHWRPRTLITFTWFAAIKPKFLNVQNVNGLRPQDIAETELQPDYVFRERMTLMVLLSIYKPRGGVSWIPTSGMTLRSRKSMKNQEVGSKYTDRVNILLVVATLVATMTFAAGFTIPGGFNSSAPNLGKAILGDDRTLKIFLVYDALALHSSIIAIIALIWAQLGDEELAHRAFHLALPSLFFALLLMSFAFFCGVAAILTRDSVLLNVFGLMYFIFAMVMCFLLTPYMIPQVFGIPYIQEVNKFYLTILLLFVNEDDGEKDYPSSCADVC